MAENHSLIVVYFPHANMGEFAGDLITPLACTIVTLLNHFMYIFYVSCKKLEESLNFHEHVRIHHRPYTLQISVCITIPSLRRTDQK